MACGKVLPASGPYGPGSLRLQSDRATLRTNDAKDGITGRVMQANQARKRRAKTGLGTAIRPVLLISLMAVLLAGGAYAARAAFCVDPALRAVAQDTRIVQRAEAEGEKSDEHARPVYAWLAVRNGSELKLRGAVPSEEDRQTMLGMVKAHFPDLTVEEKLKVMDGGPPRDQWLGAISFGLKQLSLLKQGAVRLSNANLKLSGEARSAGDYVELKKALAGPLPAGLVIKGDDVRPPVANPFIFTADLGVNALSLAGSVPSEDARKQVRDLSRQLFARPGLDDRLEVASGAPKNWDEAVTAALRALSRLESGKVALSGLAVSIEGVAPDQGTAVAVSYQLRRDLPKIFSTSESIKWKEARAPRDMGARVIPRIKELARTRGSLPQGELPPLTPPPDAR